MRDVLVVGAASTPFAKHHDRTVRTLAEEAVAGALADAGAQPDDVEVAYFANAAAGILVGQEMIRGQVALRHTGLLGIPVFNIENACASGSTAFHLAWQSIAGGASEVALVVGAEKLTHPDKARSFAAFEGAVDNEELGIAGEEALSSSRFMRLYAGLAREYATRTGAQPEDFAAVAVKSHANAARNPKAQYRDPVTVDEVLASRPIADPLTLLMCSPIGDGAAALLLCSEEAVGRFVDAQPVLVVSTVVLSARDGAGPGVVGRAAQRAYAQGHLTPDRVDVVELHDAVAPAELIVTEELGLASPDGGGLSMLRSGESQLDGRVPVNPSGGLLSKGHPIGATGCAQIVEIVDQLRERCDDRQVADAHIGLAENAGGWLGQGPAVGTVTILARY